MIRWTFTAAAIGTLIGWALVVWGSHAAIGVAVCALAVIMWCAAKAVANERARMRRERERVWRRRIESGWL